MLYRARRDFLQKSSGFRIFFLIFKKGFVRLVIGQFNKGDFSWICGNNASFPIFKEEYSFCAFIIIKAIYQFDFRKQRIRTVKIDVGLRDAPIAITHDDVLHFIDAVLVPALFLCDVFHGGVEFIRHDIFRRKRLIVIFKIVIQRFIEYGGDFSAADSMIPVCEAGCIASLIQQQELLDILQVDIEQLVVHAGNLNKFCLLHLAGAGGVLEGNPCETLFVASDDVFLSMLNSRFENRKNDESRTRMIQKALTAKGEFARGRRKSFRMKNLEEYQDLCDAIDIRKLTVSEYVRRNIRPEIREASNGQLAFLFFTTSIPENSLVLLDEPENSLSPGKVLELADYLQASVRLGTQLILSTHSPLLLVMEGAAIYDFDSDPVCRRAWYELESVRIYQRFFQEKSNLFDSGGDGSRK